MYQSLNTQTDDPNDNGYKKRSFFRRHRLFSVCCICLIVLCVYVYRLADGKPLETVKIFFNTLSGEAVKNIEPPPQPDKTEKKLLEEDELALRLVIDKYFDVGAQYKIYLYSDSEIAMLKSQHPVLANNKDYFTRVENTFFYVSNDGERIYNCEIDGELLADKIIREAKEAKAADSYRSVDDETGLIIYSPSSISGDSLDNLPKDPNMQGIFREADGTWKNY